jgi:signal transduction histidine kinase
MKPRFVRVFHWVLVAAVLTSLAAGAYLARVLVEQSSLIEHTYRQGSWGAVQVDSEALKLSLALERFRRTGKVEDAHQLDLQREIYLSRVLFLRDSSETAQIRTMPQLQSDLSRLIETEAMVDVGVNSVLNGDASAADPLASLILTLRGNTRDLTQYLLLKDSTLLNRARLVELFEKITFCVLLLLMAGSALFFLVLRQTRAARLSEVSARSAREEASRQRQRLESALDGAADPLVVSDRDGMVVFANRAYRSLVASSAARTESGAPLLTLLEAEAMMLDDTSADGKAIKATFTQRSTAPESTFLAHLGDGRTLLYRASSNPEGGLVLMRTDLTDRTRLEREHAAFRDQLHHAMKMEAIGRLAGGIAHDFNNVLTAILTFAEMLRSDLADRPVQQRMADKIAGGATRAAGLVKQILSFSRKDPTSQGLAKNDVDVVAIARETLALLRATTPQSMLTSLDGNEAATVRADPGEISQIIMNLCVNARDAIGMRPGAIEITIRDPAFDLAADRIGAKHIPPAGGAPLDVATTVDGRTHLVHVGTIPSDRPCVCISVEDNGGGIPRAVLEHMFEPFYTTKGIGQGSGLGLAAVHGIALALEGTILVETTEGFGTTFRIYLPKSQLAKAA